MLATLKINIDPSIDLGPLHLTWHGVMIAIGILAGGWAATQYARERGLDRDRVLDLVLIIAVAGMIGARIFYLAEQGDLLRPGEWLGSRGFSFYGAMILGPLAAGAYMRWRGLGMRYLDALAAGFPLGMLVGRVGDLINGEHYGPASDLPWAVRNAHPNADTPNPDLAYHSGGLYEMVLAAAMLAVIWPLRHRFRRPGMLLWAVVALYSAGRFLMFFYRSDSDEVALGLNSGQWTSLVLLAVAGIGAYLTLSRAAAGGGCRRERSSTRLMKGRVARILSTALITAGLVLLLDVGMTLAWSEPVSTLRGWLAQRDAEKQLEGLEERFAERRTTTVDGTVDPARVRRPADRLADRAREGQAIGRLKIGAIDLNIVMVQGTETASLQKGPGHYPDTVFPGQPGTVGIAGHRTTYLAPFRRINEIGRGDEIVAEMPYATFTYRFEKQRIVDPSQVGVVRDVGHDRVVLTACHPLYSAAQRIVVFARLVDVDPPGGDDERTVGRGRSAGQEIAEPGLGPTVASAGGLVLIVAVMSLAGRRGLRRAAPRLPDSAA